jgi:uncharacterized protein YyaL (SSP411 family)
MAEKTLTYFGAQLMQDPRSMPQMLVALDFYFSKHKQIVIAGDPASADTQAMLAEVRKRFLPNKILMLIDTSEHQEALARRLPFLTSITRKGGKATAYVCINYTCELPTNDLMTFEAILDGKRLKE